MGHLHPRRQSGVPLPRARLVHQHVALEGALGHERPVADQALQGLLLGELGGSDRRYAYARGKDNT